MIHVMVEPPITKDDGMELRGVYFISYFEIEYRKSRTIKGDTIHKLECATKCSYLHKIHPQSHSQSSMFFISYPLLFLAGAALPHRESGIATVRHYHDLTGCWEWRGIYTSSSLPQR